jgi:hypothetical protein
MPLKILTTLFRATSHTRILIRSFVKHVNEFFLEYRIKIKFFDFLFKFTRQATNLLKILYTQVGYKAYRKQDYTY